MVGITARRALTWAALWIGLAAPALGADVPSREGGERLLREGRYTFSYFGSSLGEETFSILRTPSGYEVRARLDLDVGDQAPSESVYTLDERRRLVRATYRELVEGGVQARYEIRDGTLVARATVDGEEIERRIELETGALVTGPHYVTDLFVLEPLGLEVGERRDVVVYAFGFDGWEPSRCLIEARRVKDRRVKAGDAGTIDAVVYRCTIRTPSQTFKTRSWLASDGTSVRINVEAPIGNMVCRIE